VPCDKIVISEASCHAGGYEENMLRWLHIKHLVTLSYVITHIDIVHTVML